MSDRPTTDTQTTDDVNAILAGMALPQQLQPGYRSDLPPGLLSPSQLPPELRGTVVPPGTFRLSQADPVNPPPTPATTPSVTPGGDQPIASPPASSAPATPGSVTPGSNAPMLQPTPPISALPQQTTPGVWQDRPGAFPQRPGQQPQLPQQQQNPTETQQRFIETYGPLAEQVGQQLGVDPRLILGQWALESGWGVGPGAAQIGNMAGIKGRDGQYVRFNSPQEFADAYTRFLRDNPRYRGAIGAGTDAGKFFGALKQAGYFGADLGPYMGGVLRNIGVFGTVAQGQGPQVQSQQSYVPTQPRDAEDWGHPPPVQGAMGANGMPQPGGAPQQSDFGRIMTGLAPLLVGIASLAVRMPLSSAILAYGATAKAIQNGQREEYERNRTIQRDRLAESTAQQTMESRAASDAFSEYGHNNPQGLQQRLMQIALENNDPVMYRMAERGDLNGIYQMQAKRDALNQDLTKLHRAQDEEADRQAQNAAVTAMDNKYRQEHPNATPDELAIAHNEHIGEAARAGTKTTTAGTGVEAPIYDVTDQQGNPTGRQVQRDKNGRLLDMNDQPTTLGPGERLKPVSARGAGGEGMEGPVYDVIGADNKPTGQQVRAGKQGGLFDVSTQQPVQLKPGERVQQAPREQPDKPEKPDEVEAPVYDVTGADGKPTGQQVRVGKRGGTYDLNGNRVTLKPNEKISTAPRGAQQDLPPFQAPDNWEGAPNRPPPGADPAAWALAVDWANQGREPPNMRYLGSGMAAKVANLLPTAQKVLGIGPAEEAFQRGKVAAMNIAQENTERYFTGGQGAAQMRSMNTVAEHLELFRQYAEALQNNAPVQTVNALKNRLAASLEGKPEVPDFHTAQVLMMDEVVRLLTNTGGTRYDREDAQKLVDAAMSGEQLAGVADTLQNFLKGKFVSLQREYVQGGWPGSGQPSYDNRMWTQRQQWFSSMLLPSAQGILNAPNLPVPGADPDQAVPLPDWASDSGTAADGRFVYRGKDGKTYNPDHTVYQPAAQ